MSVLPVIRYPDKRLRVVAEPVLFPVLTDADRLIFEKNLDDMEDTLDSTEGGLALAATQVGFPWRLIVFRQGKSLNLPPWVANPKIEVFTGDRKDLEEGCLSFPSFYKPTARWEEIEVSYCEVGRGMVAQLKREKFTGLEAQAWQHEIEHLDGKTFVDDWPKSKREQLAMQLGRKR